MRRFVSALSVFVLVLGSFSLIAKPVGAQGGAPDWSVKDFWEYSGSMTMLGQTYTAIIHIEVSEKVKVTIGGNTHDTNHCTMSISMTFGSSTVSVTSDVYLRTSDLASVKMVSTFMTTTMTVTWDPPLESFKFPLSNGQTWTSTSQVTTQTGSISNTTSETHTYSVTGPLSIAVPAGTFNAYSISEGQGINTSTVDYSDSVGSEIRFGGNYMGLAVTSPFVLKSFNYQKPGFTMMLILVILLLVIVVAVIAALLVRRGRRRAQMQSPMPPQGQHVYGQPPQPPLQPPYQPPPQP